MTKNWKDMSKTELKRAMQRCVNRAQNAEQARQIIRQELGYPYYVAIDYHQFPDGSTIGQFMCHHC